MLHSPCIKPNGTGPSVLARIMVNIRLCAPSTANVLATWWSLNLFFHFETLRLPLHHIVADAKVFHGAQTFHNESLVPLMHKPL